MKRIVTCLLIALFSFGFLLTVAPAAHAYSPFSEACDNNNGLSTDGSVVCANKSSTQDPITGNSGILLKVTNFMAVIAGIIAVFIIIVSGIRFIVSGGDPAKVSQAKNTILYSVIGLVVIVFARTIIVFIINRV